MFTWRKKPDGFEWHKYIRTTVRVRREHRRERAVQARRAAGQQASAAGAALVQGSRAAGAAAWDGTRAGLAAAWLGLQALWDVVLALAALAWDRLAFLSQPLVAALARPNIGGPIVTGGGLIFVAATMDEQLRALDVATGTELWSAKLPVPGMAVPMTYMAGGKQYVVIAAGGHSRVETALGDYLIAYTLSE